MEHSKKHEKKLKLKCKDYELHTATYNMCK